MTRPAWTAALEDNRAWRWLCRHGRVGFFVGLTVVTFCLLVFAVLALWRGTLALTPAMTPAAPPTVVAVPGWREGPLRCLAEEGGSCRQAVTTPGSFVLRVCGSGPRRDSVCTTAPMAYLRVPAAETWRTRAEQVLSRVIGDGRRAHCRGIGTPVVAIDCAFGGDDPRLALLADGLVAFDPAECRARGGRDCAALASVERYARAQRRGIWAVGKPGVDPIAAVNNRDLLPNVDQANATVLATAFTVAGAICAAAWYLFYGGPETFARRLSERSADRLLIPALHKRMTKLVHPPAGAIDAIVADAKELKDPATRNQVLELLERIGQAVTRAGFDKAVDRATVVMKRMA